MNTPRLSRAFDAERLPWLLAGAELLFGWAFLWNKLRIDWSVNEQYQYGWFVPPLALALLALRWVDRPAVDERRRLPGWALALLSGGCLLVLWPFRLIEEPNPDWRLIFWLHAGALVTLSLCLAAWAGGLRWARHFAFPILFLLLAVPWPSGPEQGVVQSLMRIVAGIAAEAMNLLGIPAVPQGNLIHVHDQWVGVDEACSGIRSLQTTLMAAFLLGELSRFSWMRRAVLLVLGVGVALLANIFRSCLLVWIVARHGTGAMERFHDSAGFSVLLIVLAFLLGINWLLGRQGNAEAGARPADQGTAAGAVPGGHPRAVSYVFLALAGVWLLTLEAGTAYWYWPDELREAAHKEWRVSMPVGAPAYRNVKIDARTCQMLRFDNGISARWQTADRLPADVTMFFFRWEPGHASIAQAEIHQPHICLTAGGLVETADWGVSPVALANGITLPVRRYEFMLHDNPIYVFYVIWQDGATDKPLAASLGSRWDRVRAVIERRRDLGRQTLEFIVSGQSTATKAAILFEEEMNRIVRQQKGRRWR